ncbi:MAG: patatin-like phospholipase family protein [Treponema sp.]|nr:patatin-like phospholipase family protein [Treponema sp.]
MKKPILFVLLFSFIVCCFAQNNTELMLDPESKLYLQDVPIHEGVEEFTARIEKIRKEEKREPLGLVLCGGSARAFCHIGTLRAMEENGIVPDFIIANSMGAIIGMLYAYGFSPDKIQTIVKELDLTSYFEPVIPLKGGLLSVRKFEALLNQLLGEESHNLKDCKIPVLILTEDVFTKRQIWHAEGDFAKIMCAAFAMSAFMEPVKYNLKDGTPVKLLDSGAIDIAGLKVARSFSSNLIVSTAFYDKEVNFNSMIVILNRTMSIAKERVAVTDIKNLKPVIVRNDVEHFSFMAFEKVDEIAAAGYKSTYEVMDILKKCPHGKKDLSDIRRITDTLVDEEVFRIRKGEPVPISENYFGLKIWPVFPVVDFPDFFLYEDIGISAYAFLDTPKTFFRGGLNYPFGRDTFSADVLFNINPSMLFDLTLFASYSFRFDKCRPAGFYLAGDVSTTPSFFPYCIKELFVTGEWKTDEKFSTEQMMFTTGTKVEQDFRNYSYVYFKPFMFASGPDFSKTSLGAGAEFQTSVNFKYFGFAQKVNARYAFANIDKDEEPVTRLFNSDFYRGHASENHNNITTSASSELFYLNTDPDISFAELVILRKIKAGVFFDFAYDCSVNYCTGAFVRGELSLVGLCTYALETGCGWDFTGNKFFAYFALQNRM